MSLNAKVGFSIMNLRIKKFELLKVKLNTLSTSNN